MRANTAATFGVIRGTSSATNRTDSRPGADDRIAPMVPRCPLSGGVPASEGAVISSHLAERSLGADMEPPFRVVISRSKANGKP